jgi:hydroxymethylpyrimidine pyrophosphatase-like HAD family hydrolase
MDDIKIYGYSDGELRNVLVLIDNYLKGHGLSINSKKTKITTIDPEKEDETVLELRRFEVMESNYFGDEDLSIELSEGGMERSVIKSLLGLSEQSPEGYDQSDVNKLLEKNITDPAEVIAFWKKEINEVEIELPNLFRKDTIELIEPENTDDIDFIRLSAKYGYAIRSLSEYEQVKASDDLLVYWLFALKKFYWRASNYLLNL